MDLIEKFDAEIHGLIMEWGKLQLSKNNKTDLPSLILAYETWYTRALSIVRQILPEREEDFVQAYKIDRRKEVTYDTYTIRDYLLNMRVTRGGSPVFSPEEAYSVKLIRQLGILEAAAKSLRSATRNMTLLVRAELLDGEMKAAKELLSSGYVRSAGVVCGVVLEAHLKMVIGQHGITLKKKDPSISDMNDILREAKIFDIPMWRYLQRLSDIRNLCAHSKDREPTKDEVTDLLIGAEKVIKEVF